MKSSAQKSSAYSRRIVLPEFSPQYQPLRHFFEGVFADSDSIDAKRFAWDYWNKQGQYRLLRTPAYHFFPDKMYLNFHKHLVMWGRKNLGCWDISPPWLSCYIDDCEQRLHSDLPHGPWAFVYSVNARRSTFKGGETLLLKEETLDYWSKGQGGLDRNFDGLVESISPKANQLLVFDPRLPHGVNRVRQAEDVMEGRLVIHGWFSQPKTYIEGNLNPKTSQRILNEGIQKVSELAATWDALWGMAAVGLKVSSSGKVSSAEILSHTLRKRDGSVANPEIKAILKIYRELEFGQSKGGGWVTAPLVFDN